MTTGEKFNKLTVIKKTNNKKKASYLWEFICDCGNMVYAPACYVKSGAVKSCGCLVHDKPKADDISGNTYGKLEVIRKTKRKSDRKYLWECKCECGEITYVLARSLKNGNTSSCGCAKYDKARKIDYNGQRFGKLIVIKRDINIAKWFCKCDCGNDVIVYGNQLKNGTAKSCGCLKREVLIKRNVQMSTHNMSKDRLYGIWADMKIRCTDKKNHDYKNYGGRGIRFCNGWNKFEIFMKWALENGYNKNLTIERINVNGNYEPLNCMWITAREQHYNKTTNRYIIYNEEKKTVSQWAEKIGISRQGLRYRLEKGWDLEDILSKRDQGTKRILKRINKKDAILEED